MAKRLSSTLSLILPFLVCWSVAAERTEYLVSKTTQPIIVDGVLSDPAWQKVSDLAFRDSFTGEESGLRTMAKVTYDDRFLYFAFEIWDENIWSTFRDRDEHLWTEEVVEVFLQGDPSHPNYIELEVNPLGTMLDIYLVDIRKPIPYESWNSAGIKWAVQVDGTVDGKPGDRKWTCEIALPVDDVITAPHLPPSPGDRWRMNLYRVEKLPNPAGLAWAPTLKRDFHVPAMFGDIVFTDQRVP